jgi:hypothetical protein
MFQLLFRLFTHSDAYNAMQNDINDKLKTIQNVLDKIFLTEKAFYLRYEDLLKLQDLNIISYIKSNADIINECTQRAQIISENLPTDISANTVRKMRNLIGELKTILLDMTNTINELNNIKINTVYN